MAFKAKEPDDGDIYVPPVASMPIYQHTRTGDRVFTRQTGTQTQTPDSAPSLDPAAKESKRVFENWVQDQAGIKQANEFWGGIGGAAAAPVQNVVNSPQFAPARWAAGKIGEGMEASHEVTEAGLGTIQAAQLLKQKQDYMRLKDQGAQVNYERSEGGTREVGLGGMRGATRTNATGAAGLEELRNQGQFADKPTTKDLTQDELNRLNSFLHGVGDISNQTGVEPSDPRVILNAGKDMRAENPSLLDTLANAAFDPMNLPLSVVGGGSAVRGIASRGNRIAEILGEGVETGKRGIEGALKPGVPAFAAGDDAFDMNGFLKQMRGSRDPAEQRIGRLVEKLYEEGKTKEEIAQILGGGMGATKAVPTAAQRAERYSDTGILKQEGKYNAIARNLQNKGHKAETDGNNVVSPSGQVIDRFGSPEEAQSAMADMNSRIDRLSTSPADPINAPRTGGPKTFFGKSFPDTDEGRLAAWKEAEPGYGRDATVTESVDRAVRDGFMPAAKNMTRNAGDIIDVGGTPKNRFMQSEPAKDVTDSTKGLLPTNPTMEERLNQPRIGNLTPEQIAEAKAPLPGEEPFMARTGNDNIFGFNKPELVGTNEYPPAMIGVDESLANIYSEYKIQRAGREFTIPSGKEHLIIRVDPNMPRGVGGETNVTRGGQRFIKIPPGLSEPAFNKLMKHELEHAGQLGPDGKNWKSMDANRVGMERRAYATGGDAMPLGADIEAKLQAGWPNSQMPLGVRKIYEQGGGAKDLFEAIMRGDVSSILAADIKKNGPLRSGAAFQSKESRIEKIMKELGMDTSPGSAERLAANVAKADEIEKRTTHFEQARAFDPDDFKEGSFTKPGENFPEPIDPPPGPRTEVTDVPAESWPPNGPDFSSAEEMARQGRLNATKTTQLQHGDATWPTTGPDLPSAEEMSAGAIRKRHLADTKNNIMDEGLGDFSDQVGKKNFEQVYSPWTKPGASQEGGVGDVYQALLDAGVVPPGKNGPGPTWGGVTNAILGTPRQLKAMGDLSALLNQGVISAFAHNPEWRTFVKDSVKAMATEDGYQAVKATTKANHSYKLGNRLGLANTFEGDVSPLLSGTAKELRNQPRQAAYEAFDIGVARKIPVLGKLAERSDKAYEAGLASLRTNIFDSYVGSWGLEKRIMAGGADGIKAEKTAKALADFVNSITGYGNFGALDHPEVAKVLNKAFFAPRFFTSRINNLFAPLVYTGSAVMGKTDWKMAYLAWKDMGVYYAGIGSTLKAAEASGAEVDWDPRSVRFATIKVGDHYIDTTGGMNRTFAAMHAIFGSLTGGETVTGSGRVTKTINPEFGDKNGYQIGADWLRTKFNVPVASAVDLTMTGNRNVVNEPLGVTGHVPLPIGINNVGEAAFKDMQDEEFGAQSLLGLLNLVGIGVNTYDLGEDQPAVREGPFGFDKALGEAVGITEPPKKGPGRRAFP